MQRLKESRDMCVMSAVSLDPRYPDSLLWSVQHRLHVTWTVSEDGTVGMPVFVWRIACCGIDFATRKRPEMQFVN